MIFGMIPSPAVLQILRPYVDIQKVKLIGITLYETNLEQMPNRTSHMQTNQ